MFPTPGSSCSRSGSPMPSFTFCFTFLHVLFERCNYFNNGCVLFSISFLSFLLLIFFLFVYRVSPGITGYHRVSPGITGYHRVSHNPVASERASRGRGGRARELSPPAHVYSCLLKHILWVVIIYPKLKYSPTDVLWLPPIFF